MSLRATWTTKSTSVRLRQPTSGSSPCRLPRRWLAKYQVRVHVTRPPDHGRIDLGPPSAGSRDQRGSARRAPEPIHHPTAGPARSTSVGKSERPLGSPSLVSRRADRQQAKRAATFAHPVRPSGVEQCLCRSASHRSFPPRYYRHCPGRQRSSGIARPCSRVLPTGRRGHAARCSADRHRTRSQTRDSISEFLLLAQHEIHHPAAANVRTGTAAVVEDVGVIAPGILKGVGEDRHPVECLFVVDPIGARNDGGREPGWFKIDKAERITKYAAS